MMQSRLLPSLMMDPKERDLREKIKIQETAGQQVTFWQMALLERTMQAFNKDQNANKDDEHSSEIDRYHETLRLCVEIRNNIGVELFYLHEELKALTNIDHNEDRKIELSNNHMSLKPVVVVTEDGSDSEEQTEAQSLPSPTVPFGHNIFRGVPIGPGSRTSSSGSAHELSYKKPLKKRPSESASESALDTQNKKRRKIRCGVCTECTSEDCGKCPECLDKPKFGGEGRRHKPCRLRDCLNKTTID